MSNNSAPLGIRFSAGLLVIVNYFAAIEVFSLTILEIVILILKLRDQSLTFMIGCYSFLLACTAFVWTSFKAVHSLHLGKCWGILVCYTWAALFLLMSIGFYHSIQRNYSQAPDAGELFFLLVPFDLFGLWWGTYLALPLFRSLKQHLHTVLNSPPRE